MRTLRVVAVFFPAKQHGHQRVTLFAWNGITYGEAAGRIIVSAVKQLSPDFFFFFFFKDLRRYAAQILFVNNTEDVR